MAELCGIAEEIRESVSSDGVIDCKEEIGPDSLFLYSTFADYRGFPCGLEVGHWLWSDSSENLMRYILDVEIRVLVCSITDDDFAEHTDISTSDYIRLVLQRATEENEIGKYTDELNGMAEYIRKWEAELNDDFPFAGLLQAVQEWNERFFSCGVNYTFEACRDYGDVVETLIDHVGPEGFADMLKQDTLIG